MGQYEEVKTRRRSEPAPAPSVSPGQRKWSGGLMPGGAMGSYCAPPVNLVTPPGPLASSQKLKSKKIKTYSAYSVSKDCAVHGPGLERQDQERKLSVERWRRSSSTSSSSLADPPHQQTSTILFDEKKIQSHLISCLTTASTASKTRVSSMI